MNILFFLTPKEDVSYLPEDYTLRQALEKMKYHGYSAVPVLTGDGRYVGTVTEGDLLWAMMDDAGFNLQKGQQAGDGQYRYGRPGGCDQRPEFCPGHRR